MFDDILKAVKDHFADNPKLAAAIPADQHDAVHNEIANHIANNMPAQNAPASSSESTGDAFSGLLGKLGNEITGNNPIVNAIGGGLVSSLASKFGLGSAVTGAIAASLPGLLQRFAPKPGASTAPTA
jgi:hypothetical protein